MLLFNTTEGERAEILLETGKRGTVVTNDSQATSRPAIFAGGDLARGGATVILAMRDGKQAAAAIHNYLTGLVEGSVRPEEAPAGQAGSA